jgi:hypothetical protein
MSYEKIMGSKWNLDSNSQIIHNKIQTKTTFEQDECYPEHLKPKIKKLQKKL